MTMSDFNFFERKLKARTGMTLHCFSPLIRKKFFQGCLRPRVKELGLESFQQYRAFLSRLPATHAEWGFFSDAIRINRTRFFREPRQLENLVKAFKGSELALKTTSLKKLRIWSSACSTGEEAFTLAIVFGERCEVLGTDVNAQVLEAARFAVYPKKRVQREVPEQHRHWFDARLRAVRPELKAKVRFELCNIVQGAKPSGKFDVITCRNVLYYFDDAAVQKTLKRMADAASPGALLMLSPRDCKLKGVKNSKLWQHVDGAVYRLRRPL